MIQNLDVDNVFSQVTETFKEQLLHREMDETSSAFWQIFQQAFLLFDRDLLSFVLIFKWKIS